MPIIHHSDTRKLTLAFIRDAHNSQLIARQTAKDDCDKAAARFDAAREVVSGYTDRISGLKQLIAALEKETLSHDKD